MKRDHKKREEEEYIVGGEEGERRGAARRACLRVVWCGVVCVCVCACCARGGRSYIILLFVCFKLYCCKEFCTRIIRDTVHSISSSPHIYCTFYIYWYLLYWCSPSFVVVVVVVVFSSSFFP